MKLQEVSERLINPEPPDSILYHYTSPAGLKGILSTGEIWATDAEFLNDRREIVHALDVIGEYLAQRASDGSVECAEILEHFDGLRGVHDRRLDSYSSPIATFVFCLSEIRDDLSQWRAYCPETGGYAIGFNARRLRSEAKQPWGFALVKCAYEEGEQRGILDAVIKAAIEDARTAPDTIASEAATTLFMLSPMFKDRAFRAEREWRLMLLGSLPAAHDALGFRGETVLRPFIKVPINEQHPPPIDKILVGPSLDLDLATSAARRVAARFGFEADVEVTDVPYRAAAGPEQRTR